MNAPNVSDAYQALYIHVPFCAQRCAYCDFKTRASAPDNPAMDAYTQALIDALYAHAKRGELDAIKTIYVGGGTPSYLGLARLVRVFDALAELFDLKHHPLECTLEANPESLTDQLLQELSCRGVTRVSLGVQSFDDALLVLLGRIHTARKAQDAVCVAQRYVPNVSIDLMCGIPGQSTHSFTQSLQRAIDLNVTHVSVYPLSIEDNTPFAARVEQGRMPDVDDDAAAEHMLIAQTLLTQHGFHRYEVASYAQRGFECQHNCAYWTARSYLGLGEGSVSMQQGPWGRKRFLQEAQEARGEVNERVCIDSLTLAERYAEDAMLGMRMSCGLSDAFVQQASSVIPRLHAILNELAERGLCAHINGRFVPTERGWLCGNEIFCALLDANVSS